MYNINTLRETFLIIASTPEDAATGLKKIKAGYPNHFFTTFEQSRTETIIQVWRNHIFE